MPQLIYTAARSEAKVNEETVEGLQAIDYRVVRNRHDVGAVGTNERVAVYYGLTMVVGRLRVASVNAKLDELLEVSGDSFDISVHLIHGDSERDVAFQQCYMEDKSFALDTEHHGETIYTFTAAERRGELTMTRAGRRRGRRGGRRRAALAAAPRLPDRRRGASPSVTASIAVAPLRWRHKQRLARWAHLGPDFVAEQRTALAVDPAEDWDDDDASASVAAVAAFLDGATLPLAAELLAEVAIEACRATGPRPGGVRRSRRLRRRVDLARRLRRRPPCTPQPTTAASAVGAGRRRSVGRFHEHRPRRRPAARGAATRRRPRHRAGVDAGVDDARPGARAPPTPAAPEVAAADTLAFGRPPDARRDRDAGAVDAHASRRPAVPRRARGQPGAARRPPRRARRHRDRRSPRRVRRPRRPALATGLTAGTAADTVGTGDASATRSPPPVDR